MDLVTFPLEDVVGSPKFVSSQVWVGWRGPRLPDSETLPNGQKHCLGIKDFECCRLQIMGKVKSSIKVIFRLLLPGMV